MKKRFSEEQIIGILREAEAGMTAKELCRKHNIPDATFYTLRKKFGGLEVSEVKRLKALEDENARLKKLLAETMLDKEAQQAALGGKVLTLSHKRNAVAPMCQQSGISERRACHLAGLSRATCRYRSLRAQRDEAPTLWLPSYLATAATRWRRSEP